MNRPAILTFLRKGKMFCTKVYPTLIETWNYIVSRIDNIKGDQDVNADEGWITVDQKDTTHPIIRFDASKLPSTLENNVLVDSQISGLGLSSVQWISSDNNNMLELYDFSGDTVVSNYYKLRFDDDNNIPQNNVSGDFIMREYLYNGGVNNRKVTYQEGAQVVVPHEVTDSERAPNVAEGSYSIQYAQPQLQGLPKSLQLYNFNSGPLVSLSALGHGEGFLIRRISQNVQGYELQYMSPNSLSSFVPCTNVSALNGLSVVTGIEYNSSYQIEAKRAQLAIVNNAIVVTPIQSQFIDTIPHSQV